MDEHLVNVDVWSDQCAPSESASLCFPVHADKHAGIHESRSAPTSASMVAYKCKFKLSDNAPTVVNTKEPIAMDLWTDVTLVINGFGLLKLE